MAATLNIQDILSEVKKLNKNEQFTLLESLVSLIRKEESINSSTKLSNISGVGSKIWNKTNIDEYIDNERQW